MKRLALVSVAVLALAACGGSGNGGGTATGQITTNWEKFFSSSTNVAGKLDLLQNGSQLKSVVQSFASNPLAKNVSAKVSSVTLQGADKATVVYTVSVGGSALGKQTGEAVLESGTWKVGDASLCKLIALSGTTPSACKK